MIISASRRTDIPSFYSKWFEQRVKEGFVYTRNPFNHAQISRISLDQSVVDCIVFWTKNPIPMLNRLDAFSDYPYYFQFTLTGYGHDVEANLPDKKKDLIPAFKQLADELGSQRVIWRYDPILFTEKYSPDYHLRAIEEIAGQLEGCTEKCIISFVDVYQKNANAIADLDPFSLNEEELLAFSKKIVEIAGERGIEVASCAEAIDLSSVGVEHNCCIDAELIGRIAKGELKVGKDRSQRAECGCAASIDIGTYNTCGNGCKYCYANFDPASVKKSMAAYDWTSPILCDEIKPDDEVVERKMKSLLKKNWGDGSLFE